MFLLSCWCCRRQVLGQFAKGNAVVDGRGRGQQLEPAGKVRDPYQESFVSVLPPVSINMGRIACKQRVLKLFLVACAWVACFGHRDARFCPRSLLAAYICHTCSFLVVFHCNEVPFRSLRSQPSYFRRRRHYAHWARSSWTSFKYRRPMCHTPATFHSPQGPTPRCVGLSFLPMVSVCPAKAQTSLRLATTDVSVLAFLTSMAVVDIRCRVCIFI